MSPGGPPERDPGFERGGYGRAHSPIGSERFSGRLPFQHSTSVGGVGGGPYQRFHKQGGPHSWHLSPGAKPPMAGGSRVMPPGQDLVADMPPYSPPPPRPRAMDLSRRGYHLDRTGQHLSALDVDRLGRPGWGGQWMEQEGGVNGMGQGGFPTYPRHLGPRISPSRQRGVWSSDMGGALRTRPTSPPPSFEGRMRGEPGEEKRGWVRDEEGEVRRSAAQQEAVDVWEGGIAMEAHKTASHADPTLR